MNRKEKQFIFSIKIPKITIKKSENSFENSFSSNSDELEKEKSNKIYLDLKNFNFEKEINENNIENFIFKKYNSQEITFHDNPKSQTLTKFEKEFKNRRNLIDFNNGQNVNEEKRNNQFDLYLNKRNKPKFNLNIWYLETEFENDNKNSCAITEVYFRRKKIENKNNTEKEGIKNESKNNSKTFFKKIDINNQKQKNKEEKKEEKNKNFSDIIKKTQ